MGQVRPAGDHALRSLAAFAALAMLVVPATAQAPPPSAAADALRRILDPTLGGTLPVFENETGQDVTNEDVRIEVALDMRNVDYQIVGILFGGGKVAAEVDGALRVEFRALSVERVDAALQAAGRENVTLNGTFGFPSSRVAIMAEEIRLAGAGIVLEALQEVEAQAAKAYLESTAPGLTVESAIFTWANTEPGSYARGLAAGLPPDIEGPDDVAREVPPPDLREPPLVLDAKVSLSYLERVSLLQILEGRSNDEPETAKDKLKRELGARQRDMVFERSAFNLAGFSQLLAFEVPPGWRVELTMTVPRGFTIEGATDELVASPDRRTATYVMDGSQRDLPAHEAALATVSNRFLVTATAIVVVFLLGTALRLPVEALAISWARWRDGRRKA